MFNIFRYLFRPGAAVDKDWQDLVDGMPDYISNSYYRPAPAPTWTVTETTYARPYIFYSPARPGKRWRK